MGLAFVFACLSIFFIQDSMQFLSLSFLKASNAALHWAIYNLSCLVKKRRATEIESVFMVDCYKDLQTVMKHFVIP